MYNTTSLYSAPCTATANLVSPRPAVLLLVLLVAAALESELSELP